MIFSRKKTQKSLFLLLLGIFLDDSLYQKNKSYNLDDSD